MQLRDFVKSMTHELDQIVKQPEKFNLNNAKYVELASQRAIYQMRELLQMYAHSKARVDSATLAPFVKQLASYHSLVIDTPAILPINRHTHANKFYWQLAVSLASHVDQPAQKLFWPSLIMNGAYDYDVSFDRVMMSDNNKTIIDICSAFEIGRNKHVWHHTHPVDGEVELSETEKERVSHFTHQANRYYNDINQNKSARQLNKDKNDFLKNLGYAPIYATYGELGEARLASRLYPNRKEMKAEDLFALLADYPAHMRGKYLANFTPAELEKIALNNTTLEKLLGNRALYNGKNKHDSAVLFTYLEIYRQQTKSRHSNFKSFLGWASGYGIAKSYKEVAANILYELMLADVPLADLKTKAIERINTDAKINQNDKPFLLRSLNQGTLGSLVSEMEYLGHPTQQAANMYRK